MDHTIDLDATQALGEALGEELGEELGTVSAETQGAPGDQLEFGVIARPLGLDRD